MSHHVETLSTLSGTQEVLSNLHFFYIFGLWKCKQKHENDAEKPTVFFANIIFVYCTLFLRNTQLLVKTKVLFILSNTRWRHHFKNLKGAPTSNMSRREHNKIIFISVVLCFVPTLRQYSNIVKDRISMK